MNTLSKISQWVNVSIFAVAFVFWSSSWACSQSVESYTEAVPKKPVVEFARLTPAQYQEIEEYAKALKRELGLIRNEEARLDYRSMDEEQEQAKHDEFDVRTLEAARKLAEKVSFQTRIIVGNGMLCGARIEILVPASADNMQAAKVGYYTYGKGEAGKKELGLVYSEYLVDQIHGLRDTKNQN